MNYQEIIQEIKDRIDIVDVISQYVTLKKAGSNYKALCPFHNEKSPSFVVNPQKQIFHCFGCGAGGDITTFIMKHEAMSFWDALNLLAKQAGVAIDRSSLNPNARSNTKAVMDILNHSLEFYTKQLYSNQLAKQYLTQRGISKDTIEKFSLGYAPSGRGNLYTSLKKAGFSDNDIMSAGVVNRSENGFYDIFRERILFPIFNLQSEPIAFGGRIIKDGQPKYLNSPETEVFKKKKTLYGLNAAKDNIKKQGYIIIVEGYVDFLMCYQHGIDNVSAPLGTSLTEDHIKIIKRFTSNLITLFDADEAGIKATKRTIEIALQNNIKVKTLTLPQNTDPDSYLRTKGKENFNTLLENALDFIDFMILTGGKNTENISQISNIISNIPDKVIKSAMLSKLSEKTALSEVILRESMYKKNTAQPKPLINKVKNKKLTDDEILFYAYLNYPKAARTIKETITPEDIENQTIKKIFTSLISLDDVPPINALSQRCTDDEFSYITYLTLSTFIDNEFIEKNIEDCIKKKIANRIEKQLKEIYEKIKNTSNDEELRTLLKENMRLKEKEKELKSK
ncbi:DNA primase [Candidatus Magnetoovum chiemensis]|nr:DNA primase [Candidatus Magnetoovum chiemensis]